MEQIIINASKLVFNQLGIGHNEKIYHKALAYELNCLGYNIDCEKHIVVKYIDSKKNVHDIESLRIDIFIHNYNIILELKAIQKKIQNQEIAQIKKYFNILNRDKIKVDYGIIINFPQPNSKEETTNNELEYLVVKNI